METKEKLIMRRRKVKLILRSIGAAVLLFLVSITY